MPPWAYHSRGASVHGPGTWPGRGRARARHRRSRSTGTARSSRPSGASPSVTTEVEVVEEAAAATGPDHRRVAGRPRRLDPEPVAQIRAARHGSLRTPRPRHGPLTLVGRRRPGRWSRSLALPLAPQAPGALQPGGFTADHLEAAQARRLLEERLGTCRPRRWSSWSGPTTDLRAGDPAFELAVGAGAGRRARPRHT